MSGAVPWVALAAALLVSCAKREEAFDGDAPDPQSAVALPDAQACHHTCVDRGEDAQTCRTRCEDACVEACEGRGSAFVEPCVSDCRSQLDAAMGEVDR